MFTTLLIFFLKSKADLKNDLSGIVTLFLKIKFFLTSFLGKLKGLFPLAAFVIGIAKNLPFLGFIKAPYSLALAITANSALPSIPTRTSSLDISLIFLLSSGNLLLSTSICHTIHRSVIVFYYTQLPNLLHYISCN